LFQPGENSLLSLNTGVIFTLGSKDINPFLAQACRYQDVLEKFVTKKLHQANV
jgi:hypothetical protein